MPEKQYTLRGPEPYESLPVETLGTLFFENLACFPNGHTIMVDGDTGRKLTSKQLLEDSCNLAEALRRYGCGNETTVALCSGNSLEFFIPVVASLFAGTIMVPVNHIYTPEELKHSLTITKPRMVFCSIKVLPKFLEVRSDLKFIEKLVIIDSDVDVNGIVCMTGFIRVMLRGQSVLPYNFQPFDGDPRKQVAFILCSSGTTGLPKGVMLTHSNVATRIIQARDPRYLSNNNVVLGLMPFFHAYGLFFGLTSIFNKHLTVMLDRFSEDNFLKTIQDYRISVVRLTPPLAIFLAKTPKIQKYDLSCVREIFCAAAPLSAETEVDLKRRLNIETIHQAYGCTEGTLALTIMNKEVYRPGSCGQVITYMSCQVRDPETGECLGPYKVGELCFKGPLVMKGYYKNPEATRESFTTDGWLRTGDLGYYDNENYFFIVDRLKELIKYKGYQVAPAELEAVLVNHPKVLDVGVVGLPDELAGELPLAFVVKKSGAEVTGKELQEYVANKVSPQKRLRGGIIFVTSIPKNPSGKILRKELKKKLQNYRPQQESKL